MFESWCFSSVVLQVLCLKKKTEEEETMAAPILELAQKKQRYLFHLGFCLNSLCTSSGNPISRA